MVYAPSVAIPISEYFQSGARTSIKETTRLYWHSPECPSCIGIANKQRFCTLFAFGKERQPNVKKVQGNLHWFQSHPMEKAHIFK
jgi:hypothetical protein